MDTLLTDGAAGADNTASQGAGTEGNANLNQGGNDGAGNGAGTGAEGQGAGGDGAGASFFDSLPEELKNAIPEELRGSEALKDHKDLAGFLKRFHDMDGELKALPKPPESADAYEIPVAEGMTVDEAYSGSFRAKALELKLTKEQVKGLAEWQNGFLKDASEKHQAAEAEAKAKANEQGKQMLQKPEKEGGWGANFDQKLDHAKRAFNALAGDDKQIVEWARDPRIGSSAPFLMLLSRAAERMSEDSLGGARGGGPATAARTKDGAPMLNFPSMDKK